MGASLIIGDGNWATKKGKLLGYRKTDEGKFIPIPGDIERGGSGTYIDKSGVLRTAGADEMRIDYSSGDGVILLEDEATNLIPWSEDITFGKWDTGSTIITTGYSDPAGYFNAVKIQRNGSNAVLKNYNLDDRLTDARSIWARTVKGTGLLHLCSYYGNTNNLFEVTEEWQRFEVSECIPTGAFNFYAVDFRGQSTLSEVIVWGAQAEDLNGAAATSYIPTNGTTVTRLADRATNFGTVDDFNSEEGVFYARLSGNNNGTTNRRILINDGSTSNKIGVAFGGDNSLYAEATAQGSNIGLGAVATDLSEVMDFVITWRNGGYSWYFNGLLKASDSGLDIIGLNSLDFSHYHGTDKFYGGLEQIKVYKSIAEAQQDLPYIT